MSDAEREKLEAQETPFDAYGALSLHPRAPLELIGEAYWLLVARAKHRDPALSSQANEARVVELNRAYEILAGAGRRAAYDVEHGFAGVRPEAGAAKHRGRLADTGRSGRNGRGAAYYELVCVDPRADAAILELAAGVILRGPAASHGSSHRENVLEAYRVLKDPELRAEYDASLAGDGRSAVAANAGPVAETAAKDLDGDPGILTSIALDVRDVARLVWRRRRASRPGPYMVEDEESDVAPVARQRVPPVLAWNTAAPADQGLPREHEPKAANAASVWFRSVVGRLQAPPRVADAGVSTLKPAPKRPARESANERLIEAAHARLMTLRDDDEPRPLSTSVPAAPAVADIGLGELAFTEGPRAGERIRLGSEPLNIGAAETADIRLRGDDEHIAREHARIWRHRDHVVFRQIDGENTLIGGEPLTLPMVVLEDGDEITIGTHRLRFTYVR